MFLVEFDTMRSCCRGHTVDKQAILAFSFLGSDDYRGGDGPLHVSRGKSNNPLYQAFIDAGVEAGYPFTDDMNGYQQEGFGWMDMTIHKGFRWNTANAYLRPALRRKNLRTETRTLITRLVFEKNRASGVVYHQGSHVKCAQARKGVILTSGAINTPQILNLSGIGNADDLKKLGIPVNVHLPGVGQNFQDHLEMYFHQVCKLFSTYPTCRKLTMRWWGTIGDDIVHSFNQVLTSASRKKILDQYQYLGNCPPTPPLTQQQSIDNNLRLMLGKGRGRWAVAQILILIQNFNEHQASLRL